MICPNCNKEIQAGLAYCPHCGAALNPAPYNYYPNNNGSKNNNVLIAICVALAVLLVGAIGIGFWYYHTNNEKEKEVIAQQLREKEKELKQAEEKKPDTVVVEKTKTVTVPQPQPTYSEPINPSWVYILGNVVNVRSSPSMGASVITAVSKGQYVEFSSDYGDWYEVYANGYYGFIRKYHTNGKRIAIAK